MIPPEVQIIIDKARAMIVAHERCEHDGGHYYYSDGFSLIAHPEVFWTGHPNVTSLSDIVFRAYVCSNCGRRLSFEDGRNYMIAKAERFWATHEAEEQRRGLIEQGYFDPND